MRVILFVLLVTGCASERPSPTYKAAASCTPRTIVIGADLSGCNWIEVDAGLWSCTGARSYGK